MADIRNLEDVASDGDRLAAEWANAVAQEISGLKGTIAQLNQRVNSVQQATVDSLKINKLAGLTISYTGGLVKLPTGMSATIIPGTLSLEANATSYIWVNVNGIIESGTSRPSVGLEIARVITSTEVTQIDNFSPVFKVQPNFPQLNNYATIEYLNQQRLRFLGSATKTRSLVLPRDGEYFAIPFEELTGNIWNTAGEFTAPQDGDYLFYCQIRMAIDNIATEAQKDLSGKISLFINNTEAGIALDQKQGAAGDLIFNAVNAKPAQIGTGTKANIRAYITSAHPTRINAGDVKIKEGSTVTAWRVTL